MATTENSEKHVRIVKKPSEQPDKPQQSESGRQSKRRILVFVIITFSVMIVGSLGPTIWQTFSSTFFQPPYVNDFQRGKSPKIGQPVEQ